MDNKLQYTKTIRTPNYSTNPIPAQNTNASANMGLKYISLFSNKNIIIIILLVIISLLLLGINVVDMVRHALFQVWIFLSYLIIKFLSFFGYTTGEFINKSADVANDGIKLTSDIADGTLHSIGDILIRSSQDMVNDDVKRDLNYLLNNKRVEIHYAEPDKTASPIQTPISTKKSHWCLVGEYQGKRGCAEINENDKCMSGSVFPSKEECMK